MHEEVLIKGGSSFSVEGLRSKWRDSSPPFQSRWGWGGGFRRIFEGKEPNILGDILEEEGILILVILNNELIL